MGTCIVCGASTEGRICEMHEEDVFFEFRGQSPDELTPGRYYRGTVDGYADFGVFVDVGEDVTGLLHRSELDRRLEGLDWKPGDEVFVRVTGVHDNGNVDLGWSIRQSGGEFRGGLVDDPASDEQAVVEAGETGRTRDADETGTAGGDAEEAADGSPAVPNGGAGADGGADDAGAGSGDGSAVGAGGGPAAPEPAPEPERVQVGSLPDKIGDRVRLEGEVVSVRQTGGPTIFEVRDETGAVDCAAFEAAGVRAYPAASAGDVVRVDGTVERRNDDVQVETGALSVLSGEDRGAVEKRLEYALTAAAQPPEVEPLDDLPAGLGAAVREAAEAVRRAVLSSRPVVVRHPATADGSMAGAAVEHAALSLVREEHAGGDAEYHYVDRRPLEDPVYDVAAATDDATTMLDNRERHGEKLPLVVLAGAGGDAASADGLALLGLYGAPTVVVDAGRPDEPAVERAGVVVNPSLAREAGDDDADGVETGAEGDAGDAEVDADDADADDADADVADDADADVADDADGADSADGDADGADADDAVDGDALTATALAAEVAARVSPAARDALAHLPAASYWDWSAAPAAYRDLAADAGYDADAARRLREAVALAAYYHAYEDKRELVADLLFSGPDDDLAAHVSEQYRGKLSAELATVEPNVERRAVGDATVAVLDAEAYAHGHEFPPPPLLADALARREREAADGPVATVVLTEDELRVRRDAGPDGATAVREVAERVREAVPDAGVRAVGGPDGRLEFLRGRREAVLAAAVEAVAEPA